MNVRQSNFSTLRLPWTRVLYLTLVLFAAQLAIPAPVANADVVLNGVYTDVESGITLSFSPFVYIANDFASSGGLGFDSAGLNALNSTTNGTLYGSSGTQVDSPFLQGISQPTTIDGATLGWVGAMATYRFDGAVAATIEFDWSLTGTLTQPPQTGALIRGKAGFVTGADTFSTNISDFAEGGGFVEDNFSYTQTGAGFVNETGTLSFTAMPGEFFYLVMGLQTYGGRSGAVADAFSTFQGNLTSSSGSISAVPEPGSASLLAVLGGAFLLRRRRKR